MNMLPPQQRLIVWITARPAERTAAEQEIVNRLGLQFVDRSEEGFFYRTGKNEQWEFCLVSPRRQGPVDIGPLVVDALSKFSQPAMVVMSGVCAGAKGEAGLGDLIVAKGAYTLSVGAKQRTNGRQNALDYHTPPASWSSLFEECTIHFNDWKSPLPLPVSYQQEWFTRLFIELQQDHKSNWFTKTGYDHTKTLADNFELLCRHLPSYPRCVEEWNSNEHFPFVPPPELQQHVRRSLAYKPNFPELKGPRCHYVHMLTDTMVRGDGHVFDEAAAVDRTTHGVDMECSVFYQVCQEKLARLEVPYLVVKGVVDHADSNKDDQMHGWGNQMAARFLLYTIARVVPLLPA